MARRFTIEQKDLRKLRVEFVDKMDSMPKFLDNAMVLQLFTRAHKSAIQGNSTCENQTRKMLDFVEKRLPEKSDAFLKALLESGNDNLALKLVPPGTSISHLQSVFNMDVKPTPEFKKEHHIANFFMYRVKFVDYMSDMPTFIDYALAINLLDKQHGNDIFSTENADHQTRKMCDIMETKLPDKSDAFLYALKESGNDYLVDLLSDPNNTVCDFSYLTGHPITRTRGGYPEYPITKRGRVLIIENVKFDDPTLDRSGSEADRKAVVDFFSSLDFEIILKSDLTAKEMENVLHEEIHDEKGSMEDCFILIIMSHGRESEIFGKDMKTINYSVIFREFNNSPFWNNKPQPKPKLIYIQACQPKSTEKKEECVPDAQNSVSSLVTPDGHFYIMYATIPGGYALRHTDTGSRLIQSLITVYKENYLMEDIETMGIKVKSMVYKKLGTEETQIALCYSCIPKRVYLCPPA